MFDFVNGYKYILSFVNGMGDEFVCVYNAIIFVVKWKIQYQIQIQTILARKHRAIGLCGVLRLNSAE